MFLKTPESTQRHPHSAVNFRSPFSVKMLTLQFSTDGQRTDNEGREEQEGGGQQHGGEIFGAGFAVRENTRHNSHEEDSV